MKTVYTMGKSWEKLVSGSEFDDDDKSRCVEHESSTWFLFRALSIQVASWGWGCSHWLPFWDPRKFANPGGHQVTILGYQYDLEFRSTQKHCNADDLSWLSQADRGGIRTSEPEAMTLNVHHLTSLPLTAHQPARDPVLSRVLSYVSQGWPKEVPETLKA